MKSRIKMNDIKIDVNKIRIGVVGAGGWGTALATHLGQKGFRIDLWAYETEVCEQIESLGENRIFLPGIKLSPNIHPSNNLKSVVSDKDAVLIVVPSHFMRETTEKMVEYLSERTIVVSASKGIENKTHLTMTGIFEEKLHHVPVGNLAVISGPSFAREVAQKVPTVVTAASKSEKTAIFIQHVFATPLFRVYTCSDVIGVEIGGAVKNVIAIAAGLVDGRKQGYNTRAAMITRGLMEIRRLGLKLGADPNTFTGLSGVGDLMLTCTGNLSRNYTVGWQLGEGKKLKDILADMRMVAEGIKTAKSVYNLSRRLGIELPICSEIYRILYEDISPDEAGKRLMTRRLGPEFAE